MSKLTLSINQMVIDEAKEYAKSNGKKLIKHSGGISEISHKN
jgi:hypothetical protein